tara:strand:+ start:457 stop:870 length:414 start_codon:yes stop_codon:yes gene_type:complete
MRVLKRYDHGGVHFDVTETPREKGERLLIDLELGSRFDSEGNRKKGEAKKLAKMMRDFTGLDKEKIERQAEKGTIPARFRGRGQEGLDAYRDMMRRRNRRRQNLNIMDVIRSLFQQQRGNTQKEEGHCVGGDCGQFG